MNIEQRKIRLLLIGPSNAVPGGTAVSFDHLLHALESIPGVEVEVISSSGIRGCGGLAAVNLVRLFGNILLSARRCDVISLHAMPTALLYIGWFLPLVARFYKKPLIYRSFGGLYYDELPWVARLVARFFMRHSDVVLLQTKELIKKAENERLQRIEWFPTARPMPREDSIEHRGICRRFVFIGQLKIAKGLQFLARAAERLPDDASVDVYGPWYDLPKDTFENKQKIRYIRILLNDEVVSTLRQYDALVFPSFMAEEGHSGIILEAYAAGIPVICTRWKALPEIVDEGKTGLLIEPQSEEAIFQAMMRLYHDGKLCRHLAAGGQFFRGRFSQEHQVEHFLTICRRLL